MATAIGAPPETIMDPADLACLRQARELLEHPGFAARLTSIAGAPVDMALEFLPKRWQRRVHDAAERAIQRALAAGISSLPEGRPTDARVGRYRALVAGTGAVGGLFGLPGLLVELPVTTTLMMRAIAEVARHEGEDMQNPDTRAACLEVFALGGRSPADDAAETAYYGVRVALAGYVGASVLSPVKGGQASAHLISAVASRFGATLSEQAAARLLPVVGALGAATVNTLFMQHFQDMARGHFTVRRLERKYGVEVVRAHYERLGGAD